MESISKISADVLMKNIAFLSATAARGPKQTTKRCVSRLGSKKFAEIMKFLSFFSCFEMVSSTSAAGDKITLVLSKTQFTKWIDKFDEIMSLEQKCDAIRVNLEDIRCQQVVELFIQLSQHHGHNVRELTLHNAEFQNLDDFTKILKGFPTLEKLEVCRTSFPPPKQDNEKSTQSTSSLNNLKEVKVVYSSWSLFQCLDASKVSSLALSTALVNPSELSNLLSFIEASENLKSIEIDREAFLAMFQLGFLKSFPFQLTSFTLTSFVVKIDDNQYDSNLITFLESQASSLRELSLEYSSRDILKSILGKLFSIEKLKLNSSSLPLDSNFYDGGTPIETMREFELKDKIPNGSALIGILRHFPNLETLRVGCDPDEVISDILPKIAEISQKLRVLEVDSLKSQAASTVSFELLETFQVYLFNDDQILLSFIKNNPTIATLKVNWIYGKQFIDKVLPILLNETSVRKLIVGGKAQTLDALYERVKADSVNLETLKVNIKTDSGIRSSTIHFPESGDPAIADFDLD